MEGHGYTYHTYHAMVWLKGRPAWRALGIEDHALVCAPEPEPEP